MATLADKGPEADDIEKFKATYEKNVELALKDNGFWCSYLAGQYENDEDILQVHDATKNLNKISAASLKQSAEVFLSNKNIITFELLPQQAAE